MNDGGGHGRRLDPIGGHDVDDPGEHAEQETRPRPGCEDEHVVPIELRAVVLAQAAEAVQDNLRPEPVIARDEGVAELWRRSLEDLMSAFASQEGRRAGEALLEDERRFIDLARSPLWISEEHEVIG